MKKEIHRRVSNLIKGLERSHDDERLYAARLFLKAAQIALAGTKPVLNELDTEAKRNKIQRKETELAPKSPVHPVKVAEPYKPKKPKYKGG